jgi:methionyl-tRNA formyltransferase
MRNLKIHPVDTLFLGTDWESVETLDALHKDKRFNIVGVITTVDKPVGRKQILTPSKVKEYALDSEIEVYHTEKNIDRYQKALDIFKPELIVCKAFGEIVPGFFLQYPKYKAINVHFSILPKYRGAVPIQKAILDGEKETGISIMLMSEGLDEGDILKIFKEEILPSDTNLSLRKRLVKKSSEVLGDVLEEWIEGNIQPIKQNNSQATYCWQKDISKENSLINWNTMEPEYIERLVRAMIPWPIAWSILNSNTQKNLKGKKIKIYESEILNINSDFKPGTLFVNNNMVLISTKGNTLRIQRFQIEGKKETNEKDFINGIGRNIFF